jgi:hypothetical protein
MDRSNLESIATLLSLIAVIAPFLFLAVKVLRSWYQRTRDRTVLIQIGGSRLEVSIQNQMTNEETAAAVSTLVEKLLSEQSSKTDTDKVSAKPGTS